ncbi:MAG: NAD(P)-dependent oxidoreductase, partial [Tepidisphaeraceae bacterium]
MMELQIMSDHMTRRSFLGAAGAATVGLAVSDASAATSSATHPDAPRLPANILLRAGISDDRLQALRALSPQIRISREVDLADAHVLLGNLSADELAQAKNLRWVQCPSAGVEHYPLAEMLERGVILTNGQGCYGPEIAEHAFGLLFALTRGIAQQARQNRWGFEGKPIEMRGMTLGIVGLGGIGREVARRGKAMDMKILAVDAEPMYAERFAMVDEVRLVDGEVAGRGLDDLMKRSDVVVSCAPDTPKS